MSWWVGLCLGFGFAFGGCVCRVVFWVWAVWLSGLVGLGVTWFGWFVVLIYFGLVDRLVC